MTFPYCRAAAARQRESQTDRKFAGREKDSGWMMKGGETVAVESELAKLHGIAAVL